MKTTLTKNQIALHKFASPSDIRPVLASVYTNGVKAVATDLFRLVEITKTKTTGEAIKPIMLRAKELKAVKIQRPLDSAQLDTEACTIVTNNVTFPAGVGADPDEFPKYEELFTKWTKDDDVTFVCRGEYLAEIVAALAALDSKRVVLTVSKDKNAPLLITAESTTESARGLLMPLHR